MKNLKNMFAWITMAVVITVGTLGANAGIIISDRQQCADKGGFLQAITGIIVNAAPQFAGIIVNAAPQTCVDINGIIITD
ncbi:MAG: hypothetical protein M3Q33_06315 [Acidobacteriota bacterium]|nr:hypothetical protein [Acidobacteriota bacterium]